MVDWEKTAAVFPGQGSQAVGMGKDFAAAYDTARTTFEQADEILGFLCAAVSEETQKSVVLANDNCPGQVVVSGDIEAVERLIALAPGAGARRAVRLSVSVAAHSPLMASASAAFQQALDKTPLAPPKIAVYGNVQARPLKIVQEIRNELGQQLTQTVRWTESMQAIIDEGAETFVEIGGNGVLGGLMRRIHRKKTSMTLNTVEALDAFLEKQV